MISLTNIFNNVIIEIIDNLKMHIITHVRTYEYLIEQLKLAFGLSNMIVLFAMVS
jgi:hypothetical protein